MLIALTRPVPAALARCELTHREREPLDVRLAGSQHERYEALLNALGAAVERVRAAPEFPDSVFIEDTAVVVDECAVITRPGAASRRGETDAVADALARYRPLTSMEAPGTLDGGDVLQVGRTIFVGLSSRTNRDGLRQLDAVFSRHGYTVHPVSPRGCLHLKSAATALSDDRLLLNPNWIDPASLGGKRWLPVDETEPFAANVLVVNGIVVCAADAPRTQARLRAEGYKVETVDMSELAKAEGALTCCSLLLHA
jgi:dimethylargininase